MLIVECIAKLVGDALCFADCFVDIPVAVAINPIVYAGMGDIVAHLYSEGTIQSASVKIL